MKTRHIFVILFGLALLLVAGSKQTFAANGLFGTIIYSQTTPGTYTWPVPAGVTNIHITAAGGGSAIGRQQVTHTDLQVHAGDVFNVSVGGAQQSPAYGEIIVGNQFTGYKKCTDGTPGADTVMTKQNGYITELTSSGLNDDRYSSYSPSFYHITLNLSDVGNPCDTSQGYYIPDHGRSGYLFIEDTSNTVNAVTDTLYQPRDYKVCVEFGSGCDKTISAIGPLAVQVWGGGGGGGNSLYGSGTPDAGGAGGGGYTTKTFNNLVAGTAYYIHVGQGGDGAQYNVANAPGGNGDCSYISVSSSASCSNAGTRATGGGGSYEAGNPRYGVAGTGIGGDTNLSGTDGSDASINNYGGVSGKPACSSPMYINQSMCINDRHQDNRNANSIDLYNIVGYGSDNFKAALITTALKNGNSLADTSGGDGYSPGNGGANGAGATAGGNGGDGMVVISYTVLSTTPNVPTGLTATAGTCGTNSIDLSWSTVTGASSYKVYQNGVPVSTINQPSSGTIASTTMSSLAAGGGYEYEVSSIVSGVESATSTPPVYQFAPSACFDYSLSNLGTTVQLGLGASAQVPVTVHKLSGTDSDVGLTLSIPSTPLHTGTSGSLSPSTVHLTSSNAISQATMSALSTALQGTFTVTVSGSATDENGAAVLRSTTFPVQVGNGTTGGINGSCISSVDSNNLVTLTASPTGQSGTVTYIWHTGVGLVTNSSPTYSYSPGLGIYSTSVDVSDSNGNSGTLSCGTVTITNTTPPPGPDPTYSNAVQLWFQSGFQGRNKPATESEMINQNPVRVSAGKPVPLDFSWVPKAMVCSGVLVSGPVLPNKWAGLNGASGGNGTYTFNESQIGTYELKISCSDNTQTPVQIKSSNHIKIIVTSSSVEEI